MVALRKESVDRNLSSVSDSLPALKVALRKESVDRNIVSVICLNCSSMSLSARRAWIEIWLQDVSALPGQVALRKESVDRNSNALVFVGFFMVALRKESVDRNAEAVPAMTKQAQSLSARRAWIEICTRQQKHQAF